MILPSRVCCYTNSTEGYFNLLWRVDYCKHCKNFRSLVNGRSLFEVATYNKPFIRFEIFTIPFLYIIKVKRVYYISWEILQKNLLYVANSKTLFSLITLAETDFPFINTRKFSTVLYTRFIQTTYSTQVLVEIIYFFVQFSISLLLTIQISRTVIIHLEYFPKNSLQYSI